MTLVNFILSCLPGRTANQSVKFAAAMIWLASGILGLSASLPFSDSFAGRSLISGKSGSGTGSNIGATFELDEPRHAGKRGGKSVWLSWVAPATGIMTLDTDGSSFDTLLGVYAYSRELKDGVPGAPDPARPFQGLVEVAREDDPHIGSGKTSGVIFGVLSGVRYEIAVDGFSGASGAISLNWSFQAGKDIIPVILSAEPDRALRAGDTLTLHVDVQSTQELEYQWFLNDNDIAGQITADLLIPNLGEADLGLYTLRVKIGGVRLFTAPVEVQINSEGQTTSLARDKLEDALDSPLVGQDASKSPAISARSTRPVRRAAGVTRGYNGTQIFNTVFARRDPSEPLHCGLAGSASYWFAYQPPASGKVSLDTAGSNFDTVLAVYTYDPPLLGYQGLIPVECDNNSGLDGLTSKLAFTASQTRNYLVVIDGVNGAKGIAHLNYSLSTNVTPVVNPPIITQDPVSLTVVEGQSARFAVQFTGTEPLAFQWHLNGADLTNETGAAIEIPVAHPENAGSYFVTLTNSAGNAVSGIAFLRVLVPPKVGFDSLTSGVLAFSTLPGLHYVLEISDDLSPLSWHVAATAQGSGAQVLLTNSLPSTTSFFRMRVE